MKSHELLQDLRRDEISKPVSLEAIQEGTHSPHRRGKGNGILQAFGPLFQDQESLLDQPIGDIEIFIKRTGTMVGIDEKGYLLPQRFKEVSQETIHHLITGENPFGQIVRYLGWMVGVGPIHMPPEKMLNDVQTDENGHEKVPGLFLHKIGDQSDLTLCRPVDFLENASPDLADQGRSINDSRGSGP